MGLYQRITALDDTKISVHRFGAALRQWAAGELVRQQIIDGFLLTGSDITDLDALVASYNSMQTNNANNAFLKSAWLHRMEDVFILCESRNPQTGEPDYSEAKAKSALGF